MLAIGAALLAPVGVLLGRIAGGTLGRWIAGVGIAGATVQVVGLSRWVLLIPGVSDDAAVPALAADARHTFELLHFWLGTIVGETIGYALTATFTVLVVIALSGSVAPRWIGYLGYASAALIATGVAHPARPRCRQPQQLRRLRRLVPVADRDGRCPVAAARPCRPPRPSAHAARRPLGRAPTQPPETQSAARIISIRAAELVDLRHSRPKTAELIRATEDDPRDQAGSAGGDDRARARNGRSTNRFR